MGEICFGLLSVDAVRSGVRLVLLDLEGPFLGDSRGSVSGFIFAAMGFSQSGIPLTLRLPDTLAFLLGFTGDISADGTDGVGKTSPFEPRRPTLKLGLDLGSHLPLLVFPRLDSEPTELCMAMAKTSFGTCCGSLIVVRMRRNLGASFARQA